VCKLQAIWRRDTLQAIKIAGNLPTFCPYLQKLQAICPGDARNMPESFTLAEAQSMLGISRRTLYNWLQQEGINAGNLPKDKRAKALSAAQLTKLAAKHGRQLGSAAPPDLATLSQEVAALRSELAALQSRVEALERQPSPTPSQSAEALSRPSQRAIDPLPRRSADTLVHPAASGGALTKTDAIRILAARHGLNVNTGKGWPWPDAVLVSEEAAIRWALDYVRGRPPHLRPDGWRWRCDTPSCPCQDAWLPDR
jgi:hypothetical protein